MKRLLKDRSFLIAIILTFLFLLVGFTALHSGSVGYGFLIFLAIPVVLGLSLGALPKWKHAMVGTVICLFFFLLGLMILGLEGYICVLMVLPIILPPIFLAAVTTHLAKRYDKIKETENLPVLILPLFLFLLGIPVENKLGGHQKKIIEVTSAIQLPYSCIEAYNHIKSVDTLIAEKSWLMKIGLPVPQKCLLDREAVGGIRTCYFSGGKIVERITALEKGKLLEMDVISYELTGRKWLGFRKARYRFDSLATNQCRMTRITTYTSELRPRFYWEPLERLGIEQEHSYVFNNLLRQLRAQHP